LASNALRTDYFVDLLELPCSDELVSSSETEPVSTASYVPRFSVRIALWLGIYLASFIFVAFKDGARIIDLRIIDLIFWLGLFPRFLIALIPSATEVDTGNLEPYWFLAVILAYGIYAANFYWAMRVRKLRTFFITLALLALLIVLNVAGFYTWLGYLD
jgi:hypothetical protein